MGNSYLQFKKGEIVFDIDPSSYGDLGIFIRKETVNNEFNEEKYWVYWINGKEKGTEKYYSTLGSYYEETGKISLRRATKKERDKAMVLMI